MGKPASCASRQLLNTHPVVVLNPFLQKKLPQKIARGKKGKELRPRAAAHHPKTNAVAEAVGRVPVTARRPAELRIVDPGTAPQHAFLFSIVFMG
jgi:hypothetical protein